MGAGSDSDMDIVRFERHRHQKQCCNKETPSNLVEVAGSFGPLWAGFKVEIWVRVNLLRSIYIITCCCCARGYVGKEIALSIISTGSVAPDRV